MKGVVIDGPQPLLHSARYESNTASSTHQHDRSHRKTISHRMQQLNRAIAELGLIQDGACVDVRKVKTGSYPCFGCAKPRAQEASCPGITLRSPSACSWGCS